MVGHGLWWGFGGAPNGLYGDVMGLWRTLAKFHRCLRAQNFNRGIACMSLLGGYLMGQDAFNDNLLDQGWRHCPGWRQLQEREDDAASAAAWQVEVHRYSQRLSMLLPDECKGIAGAGRSFLALMSNCCYALAL